MPRSATARTARAFTDTADSRSRRLAGQPGDAERNRLIMRDTRTPEQIAREVAAGRALKAKLAALKQEA